MFKHQYDVEMCWICRNLFVCIEILLSHWWWSVNRI